MGQEAVEMMTRVRPDGGGMVGKLKGHWEERGGEELVRWVWKVKGEGVELSAEAQKWLAGAKVDGKVEALDAGPMARRPEAEYTACVELLAAVRAEMAAESPGSRLRELQRPVTILSMLNCKGKKAAMRVVDEVATEVQADVVHLTAAELAHMLGGHLGQNMHWSRGSVSMLGYAAAEMNGRSVSRADADGETEVGIHVTLPPRLRSFLSTKESSSSGVGAYDGRWEELKMMQALESLVGAADLKRGGSQPDRPLLVHVHDFVEISALHDGIIAKLRHIVDRMWQRGRKVVLVGSSGSDINKSGQWRDQLVELGRDGHHIIPFHAAESSFTTILSNQDNLDENLLNITKMLQSMLGPSAKIDFGTTKTHLTSMASEYPLWHNVYDAQWVYHLASLMIGGRTPPLKTFTLEDLRYGMSIMSDRNKQWTAINPAVRPPYFSPLFTPRASMPGFMPSNPEEWSADHMSGQGPSPSSSKDYDQHEKKLLSGLINAKDIHTTFNDIIVPPETKESLIGLTSLSLVRPDAFSYGVLKTERIPGCLLYGPPGTGKTLLAKAVAKESGANMLEVSAASINDMWLGQSEKNVRALFSLARKMAPMVIFLDEADALLGARHNAPGRNAHRETITQFLREWDGLSDMRAFIMVATNRPFDLDEAVLRRLPRKILVDLPLTKERESILRVMLREESLAEDVDLAKLAVETDLYSGSDLKNLCVSAAMEAVREEVRQKEAWKGEEEFVFPEKRILTRAHFDKGMREISASISEDMESLKAIRKFDAQYGDAGRKRRGRKTMGFEVVEEKKGSEGVRVRQVAG
ncbi:P-loop containing nucleoside triphosphate hydrolase protein [Podospora aff. communis PSN243]|uniref:P-loop containing nucleoside triphosphate hydrolase protein n=1 Tax=Podospora aff. communis PSN243 TaxID=3040156 RepID=A0AAV9H4P1_9PEZI|nr:P-loop containing nucleoside triphosphate hydrolase protein [Podospora aff. communis PSN243]